jgi:hypothetical protein
MKQAQIERYFQRTTPPKPRPRVTLLDIPKDARHRIYRLLSLVKLCPINLNPERASKEDLPENHNKEGLIHHCYVWRIPRYPCECDCLAALPWQLLYVSRTIYAEVSSLLYSENSFIISYHAPGGLSTLKSLLPRTLSLLTSLTLRFSDRGSCVPDSSCDRCKCSICYNPQLRMISRNDKRAFSEWNDTISMLKQHISPKLITLILFVDCDDIEIAKVYLAALDSFPKVKHCSIRISLSDDSKFSALAEATVNRLASQTTVHHLHAFSKLSFELQSRILEHTDLIAPYNLAWAQDKLGLSCYSTEADNVNKCRACTVVRMACCHPIQGRGFASLCGCWSFPSALFLLTHNLHQEAARLFYSKNHFRILLESGSILPHSPEPIPQFLRSIPITAVKYLRSMSLGLPRDASFLFNPYSYPHEELEWINSVECLRQEAKLELLKLEVYFWAPSWIISEWDGPDIYPSKVELLQRYERAIEPLVKLTGLKDLFIYLPSWVFKLADGEDAPYSVLERQEQLLERRVMGDAYDSRTRGKASGKRVQNNYWGTR